MTLQDQKCDSCYNLVDILFPIRVLCESKSGYEMQLRHYCPECIDTILNGWVNVTERIPRKEHKAEWIYDEKRDMWHFKVPRRIKISGSILRELLTRITLEDIADKESERWIVAWFSDGNVEYTIYSSELMAKKAYDSLNKKKGIMELILGKVTKRVLKDKEDELESCSAKEKKK